MSISPDTRPTPRDQSRASVADRLLTALEGLVERHRALVLTPLRSLREALVRSIDENIAPERLRPEIDRIVAALRGLAPNEIIGPSGKPSRLGRMLGNFPQAFSHVGLVNSAFNLSRALEGPARRRGRGG